jgi:hypothetical protein
MAARSVRSAGTSSFPTIELFGAHVRSVSKLVFRPHCENYVSKAKFKDKANAPMVNGGNLAVALIVAPMSAPPQRH